MFCKSGPRFQWLQFRRHVNPFIRFVGFTNVSNTHRLIICSQSSTNPENLAKIGPAVFEISGSTGITTPPPIGERSIVLSVSVCVCECVCVFVCPRSYLRNFTSDLHQITAKYMLWKLNVASLPPSIRSADSPSRRETRQTDHAICVSQQ